MATNKFQVDCMLILEYIDTHSSERPCFIKEMMPYVEASYAQTASTLRALYDEGLVERERVNRRYEYTLTEDGWWMLQGWYEDMEMVELENYE